MANALPLILGAGAAAYLLMPKKKKKAKSKPNGKTNGNGEPTDPNIVLSGKHSTFNWQVRKVSAAKGFAPKHFGEIKGQFDEAFERVHDDGRSDPDQARLLALEAIAIRLQEAGDPSKFNWDAAFAANQEKLRGDYPQASLGILETGAQMMDGVQCYWAIADVLPPIKPGAFAGFVICPSSGEQISRFSNSIASIKAELGIT